MTLAQLGNESIRRFGEYDALAFERRRLTNVDQHRAGYCVAHALRRLGVEPGDRVVVMLPKPAGSRGTRAPKEVRIVPCLPKSLIGKILRKDLRKEAHTPS
jgi:acyl-coenzyme A synthetase/AMP-(fatty) acid ligase